MPLMVFEECQICLPLAGSCKPRRECGGCSLPRLPLVRGAQKDTGPWAGKPKVKGEQRDARSCLLSERGEHTVSVILFSFPMLQCTLFFFFLTGPKPCLSNWWTCKEASWKSSTELPGPASAEEVMPSTPSVPQGTSSPAASWERGMDASAVEGSPLQPPNPPGAQEEPLVSSAPDRYVLMYFLSPGIHLLLYALEAIFTAWLMRGTKACIQVHRLLVYLVSRYLCASG